MRRRELIGLFGGAAAAWPLTVRAQTRGKLRRIGVLLGRSPTDIEGQKQAQAFEERLSQLGWDQDRNVHIEYRWTAGDPQRIHVLARELVSQKPDVIIAQSTPIVAALTAETHAIPIVFVAVTDPVASGFVASLSKPGSNVTGFIDLEASLGGKWVELLKQIAPQIARVRCIYNPETAAGAGSYYLRPLEAAATSFGVEAIAAPLHDALGIERTIAGLGREAVGGLIVMPDIFNGIHRELIISSAARERVPAIYAFRLFTVGGGLISYGVDLFDLYRRSATYVDRILKGSQVSDLPVQLPTKFELTINLKTAKALSIDVPPSLLARADEIIE